MNGEIIKASLEIGKEATTNRAKMDGITDYDAEKDDEGYICSILVGLRHWCREHGIDWDKEHEAAFDLYNEDMHATDMAKAQRAAEKGQ